jgi:hypothetical protein
VQPDFSPTTSSHLEQTVPDRNTPASPPIDAGRALVAAAPVAAPVHASADNDLATLEAINSEIASMALQISAKIDILQRALAALHRLKQDADEAISELSLKPPPLVDCGTCPRRPEADAFGLPNGFHKSAAIGSTSSTIEIALDVRRNGRKFMYLIHAQDQPGLPVMKMDLADAFDQFRILLNALHAADQSVPMIEDDATAFGVFELPEP